MTDTETRLLAVVVKHLCLDDGTAIDPHSLLVDDLGADSLDLVELALAIEDEFDIGFSDDEDIPLGSTIGDLVKLVDRYRQDA